MDGQKTQHKALWDTRLSAGDTGQEKDHNVSNMSQINQPPSKTKNLKPTTSQRDHSNGDQAQNPVFAEFEFDSKELDKETSAQLGPQLTPPADCDCAVSKPWFRYLRVDDACCDEYSAVSEQLHRLLSTERFIRHLSRPESPFDYFDPRCYGSFGWFLSCILVMTFALSVALRISGGVVSVYPARHYMKAGHSVTPKHWLASLFSRDTDEEDGEEEDGEEEELAIAPLVTDGSSPLQLEPSPVSCILNKLTHRGFLEEVFLVDGVGDVVASSDGVVDSVVEAVATIVATLADDEGETVDVPLYNTKYTCMMCSVTKTIVCKSGFSVLFVIRDPKQSHTLVGVSHLKNYKISFGELRRLFVVFSSKKFEPYLYNQDDKEQAEE